MKFTIPGEPTGKGRPRMTRTGHTYTPEKTVNYEALVKMAYKQASNGACIAPSVPVKVEIIMQY